MDPPLGDLNRIIGIGSFLAPLRHPVETGSKPVSTTSTFAGSIVLNWNRNDPGMITFYC